MSAAPGGGSSGSSGDDRSTPARIRDAAIVCFAEAGVAATPVRQIAERAGVSAALVIHHFGSKHALRVACDQYVARMVRDSKLAAMRAGPGLDLYAQLRGQSGQPPVLAYLARTLSDGSPEVADLVDTLVADAEDYLEEGQATGVVRATADPRARACVLVLWSLGVLVLHEHARRLLDADLLGAPEGLLPYVGPALELLTQGVVTPAAAARVAGEGV